MSNARNKIRAATVGKNVELPSKQVEIEEGVFIEVRGLTFAEAIEVKKGLTEYVPEGDLSKAEAFKQGAFDIEVDEVALNIRYALMCCYAPGTDDKVFEQGDIEQLKVQPAADDHWLSRVLDAVNDLNSAGN